MTQTYEEARREAEESLNWPISKQPLPDHFNAGITVETLRVLLSGPPEPTFMGHVVTTPDESRFIPAGEPLILRRYETRGEVIPVYSGPQNVAAPATEPTEEEVAAAWFDHLGPNSLTAVVQKAAQRVQALFRSRRNG